MNDPVATSAPNSGILILEAADEFSSKHDGETARTLDQE
jgi:hypothetical protein